MLRIPLCRLLTIALLFAAVQLRAQCTRHTTWPVVPTPERACQLTTWWHTSDQVPALHVAYDKDGKAFGGADRQWYSPQKVVHLQVWGINLQSFTHPSGRPSIQRNTALIKMHELDAKG